MDGGDELPLPLPKTSPIKPRQVPWSYYMNVCTYGYSLAFVPWEYWVKHIDWMAMNVSDAWPLSRLCESD